jgi:hypothetical protein
LGFLKRWNIGLELEVPKKVRLFKWKRSGKRKRVVEKGLAKAVRSRPSKCEVLNSNSSTAKKKTKKLNYQ